MRKLQKIFKRVPESMAKIQQSALAFFTEVSLDNSHLIPGRSFNDFSHFSFFQNEFRNPRRKKTILEDFSLTRLPMYLVQSAEKLRAKIDFFRMMKSTYEILPGR